jgi:hypothetical protein
MDDKKQEWRRKQALMRLQGYSSWDIDIERDKFFKIERDKFFKDEEENSDYKEKTHKMDLRMAK